jgi:membrane peptidoglycan carboxypeptidase
MGLTVYKSYTQGFVTPEELGVNRPSAGAQILDRNGKLLYRYVDDKDGLRNPVTLDKISPAFLAATIATEDPTFFDNPGVNVRGLERATKENIGSIVHQQPLEGSGGSSITQQLVRNVYFSSEDRSARKLDRKAREIVFALELTKRYPKSQILSWYVNQISYGGVFSGVEAASENYFGKAASDLTLGEAALLAGIPQSPEAYDPETNLEAALARRDQVLDLMARYRDIRIGEDVNFMIKPEELEAARKEPITVLPVMFPIQAPHFVLTYVQPELEQLVGKDALLHDGLIVTTTLDIDLQNQAQGNLENWIGKYEASSNTHNGAMLVLQPWTGEILTMIGSRDYWNPDIDGNVNNLLTPNSPGSTLKPFVYLLSFLTQGWTPGTTIDDSPVTFREVNGTTFSPVNPNKAYNGRISLRNALGNSLNVTAFKVAQQVGVAKIVDFIRSLGFTSVDGAYGPAIAIGGVDLRAIDLTYAYSVLANEGLMKGQDTFAPRTTFESSITPIAILKVDGPYGTVFNVDDHRVEKRIAPEAQTYMVTDILSDPKAECITFGCGGIVIPGLKAGVKTGTSEPYDPKGPNAGKIGETWAFGYTPDYVVGVWAGNSDNKPVVNIFSTTIAWQVMKDTLLGAYNGRPQTPFPIPPNVVQKQTCVPAPQTPPAIDPNAPLVQAPGQPQQPYVLVMGPNGQLIAQPQAPAPPPQICSSDLGLR